LKSRSAAMKSACGLSSSNGCNANQSQAPRVR
jgi:hypothetical protein